jgi:hypothetical protein
MATPNTLPIYTQTPDVSNNNGTGAGTTMTTATGDYTGVSANHVLEHTAGSNGSYIRRLRFKAIGTNVASVARIYLNNGSTHTTATNNLFFGEVSLPATTATNTAATPDVDYVMEIALPPSWTIWVGLGTTVAAGWNCVTIAGQY